GSGGLHLLECLLGFGQVVSQHDVAPLDLAAQIALLGEQHLVDHQILVVARGVRAPDRAVAPLLVKDHAADEEHADRRGGDQLGVEILENAEDPEHAAVPPVRSPEKTRVTITAGMVNCRFASLPPAARAGPPVLTGELSPGEPAAYSVGG